MSAEDIQFNIDNPPVGTVDFDFSELGSGFMGDPLTPYTPSEDIYGPDLSPAYGALRDMPVEQQQYLLNQFFETEAGQQLSSEERKALENEVYSGLTSDQMRDLSKQAEQDTEKGGIMSPGAGGGLGTASNVSSGKTATNPLARLLSGQGGMSDLLGTGLAALMAKKAYDEGEARRKAAAGATLGKNAPVTATRTAFKGTKYSAAGGGIGSLDMAKGGRALPPRYLDGHSDGMADKVPANIDGKQPAALSDGEFVIPADVVSHLGNGNSSAGAKRLYEMMDRIRTARTGNHKQGKQINPDKFMPR